MEEREREKERKKERKKGFWGVGIMEWEMGCLKMEEEFRRKNETWLKEKKR